MDVIFLFRLSCSSPSWCSLTLHDYLLRNFNLFSLESTYEIRQDIEDSVSRMKPWLVSWFYLQQRDANNG